MLWHGTKPSNIASILRDGFKRPQFGSQMFGKGIYFADRISKSAQYCNQTVYWGEPKAGEIGYIFLCEVILGEMYKVEELTKGTKVPTQFNGSSKFNSIKCKGKYIPDRSKQIKWGGVFWPIGRTIENKSGFKEDKQLVYNEYVVYSPKQVRIKYLVKVQF